MIPTCLHEQIRGVGTWGPVLLGGDVEHVTELSYLRGKEAGLCIYQLLFEIG